MKFRLKLKTVEKTTRPFRYDLNQIPYDGTVEVRNRLKGLDLIDRVPDELWMEICDIVQERGIKTIPKKKEIQKSKMVGDIGSMIFLENDLLRTKWSVNRKLLGEGNGTLLQYTCLENPMDGGAW